MVKSRIAAATRDSIANDMGTTFVGPHEIHEAAIDYFQHLLTSERHESHSDLLNLIPNIVTHQDNEMLIRPFFLEETRAALVSIPLDCASGLDGFTAAFFSTSWELIKEEVLAALNELLRSTSFPLYITHTTIVLIPKKRALESLANFRAY